MMCLGVNKCHGKNENGKGRGLTRRPTLDWGLKEYDAGAEEIPCRKSQDKAFQAK